jgi:hypothetical protein
VPFQIEDWASEYKIPLGLTNNASVFNGRTMLVFLANKNVSEVTIWWNGNDDANQTSFAYTNRYFTDNPSNDRLSNGRITLQMGNDFTITSTVGTQTSTSNFMRINTEASVYGADPAYTITSGIVRDIIQQEAEWQDGATNSPNVYAQIVITLPANVTYYTYQLRLMFTTSQQSRTLTDLCPIRFRVSSGQQMTENGTATGYPIVSNSTASYYNQSASSLMHHWSQFISSSYNGAGIMFTDYANQMLYTFDSMAGGSKTGALKVSTSPDRTIELLPVTLASKSFTYALDVMWYGAVATFNSGATPVYKEQSGIKTGLWIIVEYPPTIAVNTES